MTKHYTRVIFKAILIALMGVSAVMFKAFLPAAILISDSIFMMSFYKNSLNHNIGLSAVSLATVSAASVYMYGLSATALFTALSVYLCIWAIGAAIGFAAKKGSSFVYVIAYGTISALLPILMWFFKNKFLDGINILEEYINKPVSQFFTIYRQMVPSNTQNADQLKEVFENLQWYLQQTMAMIIPSCFILVCTITSYLVFVCGRKLLSKVNNISLYSYPLFNQLQMPKSTSFAMAVLFIISFFTGTSNLSGAITNVIIVLSAFYMVCGISVTDAFLSKKISRPILKLIIYAIALCGSAFIGIIIPFFSLPSALLLLGVIDSSLDFRRLRKGDIKNEQ